MDGKEQLKALYQRYQDNQCSEEEFLQLLDLLSAQDEETRQEVLSLFEATWNSLKVFPGQFRLPQTAVPEAKDEQQAGANYTRVVLLNRSRFWIKYVAAAAVLILVAIGIWWFASQDKPASTIAVAPQQQDLPPGREGAILTLANGRQVVLDSTFGKIANEGGAEVFNQNGGANYQPTETSKQQEARTEQLTYHTMTTPRGRVYSLILSDGTKVWLNAASSIRYPTTFTGKERIVDITGEAYFEVAHNASKPFIVSVHDSKVEVLGTHFNINSYSDEPSVKTTLLEGKVRVTRNGSVAILKPGEQSVASFTPGSNQDDHTALTINRPDLDEVIAWKNGRFQFAGATIETIMKQIARYYDAQVVYRDKIEGLFVVDISRDVPVSKLLQILELTNRVHFTIKGETITVMK